MATKIAETYFRIEIELNLPDQEGLEKSLDAIAANASRGLFNQQVEVVSFVTSGSIRGWVVAAGTMALAIEHYGGFRDGLDYLIRDARTFSDQIISTVQNSGVPESKILRTERRLGVPGRVKRLLVQLDELKSHGRDLSKAQYDAKIESVKRKTLAILGDTDDTQDRALIVEVLPSSVRSRLPSQLPKPRKDGDIRFAIRPEEFEPLPDGGARLIDSRNTHSIAADAFRYPAVPSDPVYALEYIPGGFKLRAK